MSIGISSGGGEELLRRISRAVGADSRGPLTPNRLNNVELAGDEVQVILEYRRRYIDRDAYGPAFPMGDTKHAFIVHDPEITDTLFELITAPVDLATERGRDAEQARRRLGLRSEIDVQVREGLLATYGSSYLAEAAVFGRLHATLQTMGLPPLLEQLGLKSMAYVPSDYSGDMGVLSVMQTLLVNRMSRPEQFNPGYQALALLTKTEGEPVILINGGRFFSDGVPHKLVQRIADGQLRFIQHNAADENANKKLPAGAIIIDLANSIAKKIEAQVIGEQSALHCAAASLEHLHVPLSETHVIVKGAGLIGGAGVSGLLAFGYAPEKITVIDTDPSVLAWARSHGITNAYPVEPEYLSRLPHAVMLVATRGMGLTAEHLPRLPRNTVVLTMTTDGGGIDVESFFKPLPFHKETRIKFGAHGASLTENNVFADLVVSDRSVAIRGEERMMTFVNCRHDNQEKWRAYPKNLVDTTGQMALVTSAMLAIAVCEAKAQTKPGVHPISPAGIALLEKAVASTVGPGPLIARHLPEWLEPVVRGMNCRLPSVYVPPKDFGRVT